MTARPLALAVALAIAARAGVARAGGAPPAPTGGGTVLLPAGATWRIAVVPAARPSGQLGAVVLGGLDVAAGRRADGVPVTGDDATGAPPPGWPLANRADAVVGAAPIGTGTAATCRCATPLAVGDDERLALLWATARFEVGPDAADLRVLDLHARYGDGLVVWLNGVEVARRRIGVHARPMAMASQIRGPEWETFHVPVVPGLLRLGDNVVAVEVRPSGRSPGPRLDLELVGRPGARLDRGPVLAAVTDDAATVVVETDLGTDAYVEWGPTDALGTRVDGTEGRVRHHELRLTGLPASAPVYYRVVVGGAATPVRSFRTLPRPGEVVRIAAYGDSRGGHDVHAQIVRQILAEAPDLVIATGDLVLRGSDEGDWQRFFQITADLVATIPFWSAPGNHDAGRTGDARRRFADLLSLPTAPGPRPPWASWYSIDAGDVHVTFLDSNAYDEDAQVAWLDQDLAAARRRGARALIAVTHEGPYARGNHGGNPVAVARYVPVLVRHDVTLLLSGHDHLYQRGRMDGLDYIVTGGGGAGLYALACGVRGRPACKVDDGMRAGASEHHYLMLTAYHDFLEVCPKRPDGSPLEECTRYPLR